MLIRVECNEVGISPNVLKIDYFIDWINFNDNWFGKPVSNFDLVLPQLYFQTIIFPQNVIFVTNIGIVEKEIGSVEKVGIELREKGVKRLKLFS